ncbi:MAG: Uma2 family endonuclease [Saprospirales bacterium]|nr:Uma2 family endonuclease [Saprospirales bacterium]
MPPDNHLELIRGGLIGMSPSGNRHSVAVNRINLFLIELLGRKAFMWGQTNVLLDQYSAPEPDIAVLKFRDDFSKVISQGRKPSFWQLKVADTSLQYDRKIKAVLYAEFGIPEYWILNLRDQCVEQYQLPGAKGYLRKTIVQKDKAMALPGLDAEIHVSACGDLNRKYQNR